ncbi:hypothetical protein D3C71_1581690 [compost metagenome]
MQVHHRQQAAGAIHAMRGDIAQRFLFAPCKGGGAGKHRRIGRDVDADVTRECHFTTLEHQSQLIVRLTDIRR